MALIGPRPERPEFIPRLARLLPDYPSRLLVRPGITGLAQVQLPSDTNLESVRAKLVYDLYYVRQMSLTLDIRIYFATLLRVLGCPYALIQKLALLPRPGWIDQVVATCRDSRPPQAPASSIVPRHVVAPALNGSP
jgi:hypothetical protein